MLVHGKKLVAMVSSLLISKMMMMILFCFFFYIRNWFNKFILNFPLASRIMTISIMLTINHQQKFRIKLIIHFHKLICRLSKWYAIRIDNLEPWTSNILLKFSTSMNFPLFNLLKWFLFWRTDTFWRLFEIELSC